MNRKIFKKIRAVKGNFLAKGKKFGLVVSEFNEFLTYRLLDGALDTLWRHGALAKDVRVVYVPGAFETPLAAKKLVAGRKIDAVIVLSVVIRGQTKHFDQVALESARAMGELIQKSEVPIIFGMIFADTVRQAIHRVGLKQMNKGREWALAAIEMANLMRKI